MNGRTGRNVTLTRWSINGRFLEQGVTGVQRYAREVVRELDALLSEGHPATDALSIEIVAPPTACDWDGLRSIQIRRHGRLSGHAWEQLELPFAGRGWLLNLGNTAPLLKRDQIVCIHDANTRLFPQSYSRAFRTAYRLLQPVLGRSAAAIATVSNSALRDLEKFSIAPSEKTFVAYNGHEHALRWRPRFTPEVAAAAGDRTIVILGSRAPHKNIGALLDLAPVLAKHGFRLAVVGNLEHRVFRPESRSDSQPNVVMLGSLDDESLAALLSSSMCLAFPSYAEGFGLPAVEAMAAGTAVVSSDRTSLPEVCGAAALYAPPNKPDEWLRQFLRLAEEPGLRESLIAAGRVQMNLFSWRKTAETYLMQMNRLAGNQLKAETASAAQQA